MVDRREATDLAQLKVRIREPLRARLELSAKSRGTSLNAELVSRVERSYDRQDLLSEALKLRYDDHIAGLLIGIGTAMDAIARESSPRVLLLDNPDAYAEALCAVREFLQRMAPKETTISSNSEAIGKQVADELSDAVRSGQQGGEFDLEALEIRELLGLKPTKRTKP